MYVNDRGMPIAWQRRAPIANRQPLSWRIAGAFWRGKFNVVIGGE